MERPASTASLPGVWTCRLCGEVIFSLGCPSRCPACGALPHLLVEPLAPVAILGRDQEVPGDLVEAGRRVIVQESDTAELYSRIAAAARHPWLKDTFRALQRVEARHAGLLAVAFRVKREPPTLRPDLEGCSEHQLLDLVRARETDTIDLYRSLLLAAAGTDLEIIFRSLMDVEEDHNRVVERLAPVADTWPA